MRLRVADSSWNLREAVLAAHLSWVAKAIARFANPGATTHRLTVLGEPAPRRRSSLRMRPYAGRAGRPQAQRRAGWGVPRAAAAGSLAVAHRCRTTQHSEMRRDRSRTRGSVPGSAMSGPAGPG